MLGLQQGRSPICSCPQHTAVHSVSWRRIGQGREGGRMGGWYTASLISPCRTWHTEMIMTKVFWNMRKTALISQLWHLWGRTKRLKITDIYRLLLKGAWNQKRVKIQCKFKIMWVEQVSDVGTESDFFFFFCQLVHCFATHLCSWNLEVPVSHSIKAAFIFKLDWLLF